MTTTILAIETSCDETSAAVLEVKNGIPIKPPTQGRGVLAKPKQSDRVNFDLKSHIISSQEKIHAKYGGIVPEIAARMQMEMIIPVLEQALVDAGKVARPQSLEARPLYHRANKTSARRLGERGKSSGRNKTTPVRDWSQHGTLLQNIDYIAVTQGPGLITSLTVGVETAKTLALVLNKPLIPVNHLVGHLMANYLRRQPAFAPRSFSPIAHTDIKSLGAMAGRHQSKKIVYPAVGLIVSGGHTMLVYMKSESDYKIIGQTVDDAAGEAFDKVAKILGLGYPGGPIISKFAEKGNPVAFDLPRPMIQQNNLDFSFSGLKTAVLYSLKHLNTKAPARNDSQAKRSDSGRLKHKLICDMCASFQQAVIDVLVSKTLRAIKQHSVKSFLLGGGVAANSELRKQLKEKIEKLNAYGRVINHPLTPSLKRRGENEVQIFIPELKFTGDNAAMIAVAAFFKITKTKKQTSKKHQKSKIKHQIKNIKADPNLTL